MRRNVWLTVLVTVVALGGLALIGYNVYQAGYHQGLVETGADVVVPAFRGYHGFFPFFPIFGFLFAFLLIGLISRAAFGRRWHGGPYRGYWEGSPMENQLRDWHDRAHGSESTRNDNEKDS